MAPTPKILPQVIATVCATFGALAMGAVLGYSSPAGIILTNSTESNVHLTDDQNSWFSSVSNLGALMGGLIAGFTLNFLGRKGTMIYSLIPVTIGWVLIAAAQNFSMLLIGRIATGMYCGILSLTIPTYIGEFSSPHIRGALCSGFQLMVVTGILFAYCMGAIFENSYQWIAGVCAVLPCIFTVLMLFNKESPHFLLSKGKDAEAEDALRHFRGKEYDGLYKELEAIRTSLEESKKKKASLKDLKAPYILKPFIMSMGVMFFQQFSGINAVLFNLSSIFEDAGTDMSANVSSIIIGLMQVVGTVVALGLTDKAGRKILLMISAALMGISLVALGVFFYIKEHNPEKAEDIGWLPLASLIVFIVFFSIGYGPLPWVIMSELFSPEIKELCASIATTFNWTSAFITTVIFAPLKNGIHDYGVYWMFAGFCTLSFIFVLLVLYETKGKTLQEINAHFGGPQNSSNEKNREAVEQF